MSDIKLVLTDFDGTVVEFGKHIVSDAVRDAVIRCEDAGIRVVPVTGRYHRMAQGVLELLGFEDLGVFDNGATIQNCKTGKIVWSKWLDPETIKAVTRICVPYARLIDYVEDHDEHEPSDDEIETIDSITDPTSHVYALIGKDKVQAVSNQLAEIPNITFYWAESTRDNMRDTLGVQITHQEADKFHGVNALKEILDIDEKHTLAIGDGDNDIALFKNAGLKVAMGNATEKLKSVADHTVATVQDDGFVEAMEEFVLTNGD